MSSTVLASPLLDHKSSCGKISLTWSWNWKNRTSNVCQIRKHCCMLLPPVENIKILFPRCLDFNVCAHFILSDSSLEVESSTLDNPSVARLFSGGHFRIYLARFPDRSVQYVVKHMCSTAQSCDGAKGCHYVWTPVCHVHQFGVCCSLNVVSPTEIQH